MTPYYAIYREHVKHNGIRTKKWLRRPLSPSTRWSWAETPVGRARFPDAQVAEAYAKDYRDAEVAYIDR